MSTPHDPFGGQPVAPPPQVCYRHPDRRAGVSCQRCGRPICPSCMVQASVGFHCPDCVQTSGAQVYDRARLARMAAPYATYTLIAINVAVFLIDLFSGGNVLRGGSFGVLGERGALTAAIQYRDGELGGVAFGEWWRIVTGGFLHAGFMHLAFNMYALYILGSQLEGVLGRAKFVMLYVTALLAGSFAVLLIDPRAVTVGASGAIFGLFGVAFVFQRQTGIDPWRSGVGALIGINLVLTFAIPGISISGHIGGLVGGALAALAVFEIEERTRSTAASLAVCGAMSAALVLGCLWAAQQFAHPLLG
ncbi:MAG: rhomboid family intramembrane serine protease [Acidimicrobiales bacterium]|nr:rhomboid family intramembrane serine protease [Acidimicrobiales bacterium]MCB1250292.1 rhomboid family intramembrane serine protease [Acidimicrobiales bacterium]MCB1260034.1 rhomboid family intramembrane serine protease [Acidimicrobiales bacterium]